MNISKAIDVAHMNPAPDPQFSPYYAERGEYRLQGYPTTYASVCFGGEPRDPEVCHIALDLLPPGVEVGVITKLKRMGFRLEKAYPKARDIDHLMMYHFHFTKEKGGLIHAVGS